MVVKCSRILFKAVHNDNCSAVITLIGTICTSNLDVDTLCLATAVVLFIVQKFEFCQTWSRIEQMEEKDNKSIYKTGARLIAKDIR